MKRTLSLSLFAVVGAAHAQYAVVPSAYATTPASTHGFNVLLSTSEKTGQMLINANQLTGVAVGSKITGLSFRLYTGATAAFPTSALSYSSYDISIGSSIGAGDVHLDSDAHTTFADNFIGTPTVVRSGALTVSANSFSKGGSPNAWGYEITFLSAYTYTGGNLGIQISHSSRTGANPLLEIANPGAADYGFYYGSGAGVTNGSADALTVTRLTTVAPVPEPATIAALGFGALAVVRRRRQAR